MSLSTISIDCFQKQLTISDKNFSIIKHFFTFLENRDLYDENPVPYGLLLHVESYEEGMFFCNMLEKYLEQAGSKYLLVHASEKNFRSKHLRQSPDCIFILSDLSPDSDINHIYQEFKMTPEIIKIVIVSDALTDGKLKENSDLYYRLLPRHLSIKKPEASQICERFLFELKQEYHTDRDYEAELLYYIETIYEEADLKGSEFIKDMWNRTLRSMDENCGRAAYKDTEKICADFVPYSEKVRIRKETDTNLKKLETSRLWLPEFAPPEFSDMPASTAVIILFLSDYRDNPQVVYSASNGKNYYGIQTVDAPIQYLVDTAQKDGATDFVFLCLTSHKVAFQTIDSFPGQTAYSRFKELVDLYTDHHASVKLIRYDYLDVNTMMTNPDEISNSIFQQITEAMPSPAANAYIEYTGGLRDISFLMTSILRYLQFSGTICRKIVYSNYNRREIVNLDHIYNLYQIINGTDEFLNYGNSRQLKESFASQDPSSKTRELLEKIQAFSDAISICDVTSIDDTLKQVESAARKFDLSENDIASSMLQYLLPTIKTKLHLSEMIIRKETGKLIDYPLLIQWCVDHNLIQQAVTLYIEKMPVYYYQMGIIPDFFTDSRNTLGVNAKECDDLYKSTYELVYYKCDDAMLRFPEALSKVLNSFGSVNKENQHEFYTMLSAMTPADACYHPAYKRLCNILDRRYIHPRPDDTVKLYNWILKDDIGRFLEKIKTDQLWPVHYLVYNNSQEYFKRKSLSGGSNVYNKKLESVRILKNHDIPGNIMSMTDQDTLGNILLYYLAIKLLRNHMNHASETPDSSGEEAAKNTLNLQYLKDCPIPKHPTRDSIVTLLNHALAMNRNLSPIHVKTPKDKPKQATTTNKAPKSVIENVEKVTVKSKEASISPSVIPLSVVEEIKLPPIPDLDGVHMDKLKVYIRMVMYIFQKNPKLNNQADWNHIREMLGSTFGSDAIPAKQELLNPGINLSPLKCLVMTGLFQQTANPQHSGNPFVKLK